MLKAMGKELKHQDSLSNFYTVVLMDIIRAAVRAARKVRDPDYKAMWEGLKKDLGPSSIGYKRDLLYFMAEIERRHGGKA